MYYEPDLSGANFRMGIQTSHVSARSIEKARYPHLLVSMCSQDLGPKLQAVDSLPAVHLPESILGTHGQCPSQQHCQLPDACEGLLIGSCHVQAKHLYHTAGHEMYVGHAGCIHELSVLYKAAVHTLQAGQQKLKNMCGKYVWKNVFL